MMSDRNLVEQTVPTLAVNAAVAADTRGALALTPALAAGFLPAFRHRLTGETRLCQAADGGISDIHLLDGLPASWIRERDGAGRPLSLIAEARAGYLRGDRFWTLTELRHPRLDG